MPGLPPGEYVGVVGQLIHVCLVREVASVRDLIIRQHVVDIVQ